MSEPRTAPVVVNLHVVNHERPFYTLYIGRRTRYTEFTEDSKYCNPFHIGRWGDKTKLMFEVYAKCLVEKKDPLPPPASLVKEDAEIRRALARARARWGWDAWDLDELTGQILACWCVGVLDWCHGLYWVILWHERFGGATP